MSVSGMPLRAEISCAVSRACLSSSIRWATQSTRIFLPILSNVAAPITVLPLPVGDTASTRRSFWSMGTIFATAVPWNG